jgi:hypothetical protein
LTVNLANGQPVANEDVEQGDDNNDQGDDNDDQGDDNGGDDGGHA